MNPNEVLDVESHEPPYMELNPKVNSRKVCYLNGSCCEKYLDSSCKEPNAWKNGVRARKDVCPEEK